MRVVFFGTPEVAVQGLRALSASSHDVVGVVTQPDKARGRSRSPSPPPVKVEAAALGLRVLQPATPRDPSFADELRALGPDVLAVVAYGHILPPEVLSIAPAMNVHFSLLPAFRGAAPVQRALMAGVDQTGVSVFLLEPTVDTGPVVATEAVPVGPEETSGDLLRRLAPIGAALLVRALDDMTRGTLTSRPQDDAQASSAPKIKPEESVIDWTAPAGRIVDLVRALDPAPGARTTLGGKQLIVWRARVAAGDGPPGELLDPSTLTVTCGAGAVELTEVQLEGKRRLPGVEFARGRRLRRGERLGAPLESAP